MPFKRKSEGASTTPAKRGRPSLSAKPKSAEAAPSASSPQTGEKRKRGRPRKSTDDVTPNAKKVAPSDGSKRGRGRPKKILTPAQTAAAEKAAANAGPKKGRGRPRKEPGTETTPAKEKKKDGRGRPRKSLPTNGDEPSIFDAKADAGEEPLADVPKGNTGRSYWLMKAEPESRMEKGVDVKFSIDDLAAADKPEPWDGVRNPVARNLMRDMKRGDYAFFYHSNCKTPAVVGVMEIVQEHSPDEAAFDPKHPYYDPKSVRDVPKWVVVHVEFRRKFENQVTLHKLKEKAEAGKPLENLQMVKQSRLSVSSVTPAQWRYILELAGEDPNAEIVAEESKDGEKKDDKAVDSGENAAEDKDPEDKDDEDKDAEADQDSELEL
ncbi:hypothetical protein N7509_013669 [Penicillium cosmopolitanum]|uniref:Thymocyte nuclear protein 1 n=1 Tax=Penicillium cosmopolitanum TaxID=1131564 RepID=A0A9W9SID1_9EURO|nr:uncharacterized protein N7509_013669 [Penicillium cosmopolitanum]KAJ5376783.1 hypothetical protein N7509_013669 [Penicillium cosmopolitanum]